MRALAAALIGALLPFPCFGETSYGRAGVMVAFGGWKAFDVPSLSMEPTIWGGDKIVMRPLDAPEDLVRGDVIGFEERGRGYVYRLIGLPGDTVQMRDGVLVLNGGPVVARKAATLVVKQRAMGGFLCDTMPVRNGDDCSRTTYREELPGGVSYLTINPPRVSQVDNTGIFTVPEGHVFVIGDNRDISLDSRTPTARDGRGFIASEDVEYSGGFVYDPAAGSPDDRDLEF